MCDVKKYYRIVTEHATFYAWMTDAEREREYRRWHGFVKISEVPAPITREDLDMEILALDLHEYMRKGETW
jgi:hypothetical protein